MQYCSVSLQRLQPSGLESLSRSSYRAMPSEICAFAKHAQDSVVRRTSIQDILSGEKRLPFTSRTAWLATQAECADLRRTRAHLQQGTRPSKKLTNVKWVQSPHLPLRKFPVLLTSPTTAIHATPTLMQKETSVLATVTLIPLPHLEGLLVSDAARLAMTTFLRTLPIKSD